MFFVIYINDAKSSLFRGEAAFNRQKGDNHETTAQIIDGHVVAGVQPEYIR